MVKRRYRPILFTLIVTSFSFIIIQNSIASEENAIFDNIDVSPLEPPPCSAVSFHVGINKNITVQDVRLIVQECRNDVCFINDFNVSMNYSYSCCWNFYRTKITLIHEDATKIKYYVKILNNGTWYNSDTNVMNLSNTINNTPVINPEKRLMPGFDFVLFIFSTGFIILSRYKSLKKNK